MEGGEMGRTRGGWVLVDSCASFSKLLSDPSWEERYMLAATQRARTQIMRAAAKSEQMENPLTHMRCLVLMQSWLFSEEETSCGRERQGGLF